jgi:hypothetical protein
MYHLLFNIKRNRHFAHIVYLCVSYGSQNKQVISLSGITRFVFVMGTHRVFCEVGTDFF